jgi:hypothetical protein
MKNAPKAHVTVRLGQQTVRCYQVASRRLQRLLGDRAPSTLALLLRQLSHRSPRLVAGNETSDQRRHAA